MMSYEHDEKGGLVQFSDNYIIKACVRYFLWNFNFFTNW